MSLQADAVSVAIHLLVIADLSAITLNVFFETAHLGRLKFFDFARIKREDLFELLFTTTSPATPEAKQKYEGILILGQYNQRGKFFAFFLTCLRKKVAKTFRLCEIKEIGKRDEILLCLSLQQEKVHNLKFKVLKMNTSC